MPASHEFRTCAGRVISGFAPLDLTNDRSLWSCCRLVFVSACGFVSVVPCEGVRAAEVYLHWEGLLRLLQSDKVVLFDVVALRLFVRGPQQ